LIRRLQTGAPSRRVGVFTKMMSSRSTAGRVLGFATVLSAALAAPAAAYLTDAVTHAPPTAGALAVGVFTPDRAGFPGVGQTFVDPVFGTTIRRLTNEVGRVSSSDI
jgi:hypothetical protein